LEWRERSLVYPWHWAQNFCSWQREQVEAGVSVVEVATFLWLSIQSVGCGMGSPWQLLQNACAWQVAQTFGLAWLVLPCCAIQFGAVCDAGRAPWWHEVQNCLV
jgi:hypothetical protein